MCQTGSWHENVGFGSKLSRLPLLLAGIACQVLSRGLVVDALLDLGRKGEAVELASEGLEA